MKTTYSQTTEPIELSSLYLNISQGKRSILSYPLSWETCSAIHSIQLSSTEFLSLGKENLTKLIKFKECYPTYIRYKYHMYIVVAHHFALVSVIMQFMQAAELNTKSSHINLVQFRMDLARKNCSHSGKNI